MEFMILDSDGDFFRSDIWPSLMPWLGDFIGPPALARLCQGY